VGLLVHNVRTAQPRKEAILLLVLVVLATLETLLSVFVLAGCRAGYTVVPVEVIVVDEVGSDGLEVDKHVVELLQDEEARCHALTSGDGVALGGTGAHHLEKVLTDSHVLLRFGVLANHSVHNSLQDVLLGQDAVHVLDQVEGLLDLFVFEVVDD
jgi:hypothetical protein